MTKNHWQMISLKNLQRYQILSLQKNDGGKIKVKVPEFRNKIAKKLVQES